MTACCGIDVRVFGHPSCDLRPPWAATSGSAWRHCEDDTKRRNAWSTEAWAELKQAGRRPPRDHQEMTISPLPSPPRRTR